VARIKSDLRSLGPEVSAARMVRDYVQLLYEPTAGHTDKLWASGAERARSLAAWKQRILAAWKQVQVGSVETDTTVIGLGAERAVEAFVALGALTPDDVAVQLVHGPVGQNDEIEPGTVTTMTPSATDGGGLRYHGSFTCATAGRYGFTVRVVPYHRDLATPLELGRVAWA
jgi:starch phosphorylase